MNDRQADSLPAPARLPPELRVYAVGDIHGCDGQLETLHRMIAEDAAKAPEPRRVIVYLGDYVDRGPDSASVIATLCLPPRFGAEAVHLAGNHEAMMLDALSRPDDQDAVMLWAANGGAAALASWGIDLEATAPERWAEAIPDDHLVFLRTLRRRAGFGGYLFVHAGIRPGVPLDAQDPDDLLWIREPFLSSTADHGVVVVHGHTPSRDVVVRRNRIGLDTGAVYGGKLTCAVLWSDRLRFLQA
ncbi:metallophosphoesterase family protein [Elioraea rosea]|uniref:metallophosphoesterase family protein n=1 Tax=Elioraea rosea TaxID=2492390 RepID=UPI001EF3D770|nr:metallophosphoesterase family protein [Elioraea rosea]